MSALDLDELEKLNQQAKRLDDAKREAKAAEELAAMRAETVGSA